MPAQILEFKWRQKFAIKEEKRLCKNAFAFGKFVEQISLQYFF